MFQRTAILGISMTPRHNRRILVGVAYAFLLAITAALSTFDPLQHQNVIWTYWAVMVVSHLIFGALVRPMFPLNNAERSRDRIHISPYIPKPRPEEDERETALRSNSYVRAYRVITIYSVVLLLFSPLFLPTTSNDAFHGMSAYKGMALQFFVLSLFVLVLTLPQAMVLWSESDLFVEGSA